MTFRLLFYLGYYMINLFVLKDWLGFALTLPMLFLVLGNVAQIRDRYFTVGDMIHFLMFLFFVIEPMQAIDHGHIGANGPVSRITYTSGQMAMAMAIGFIFYATFTFVVWYKQVREPRIRGFAIDRRYAVVLLAVVAISFAVYVMLTGGMADVLSTRYDRLAKRENATSDTFAALSSVCIGTMTMGTTMLAVFTRRRIDVPLFCFLTAFVLVLICLNPFNAARFTLLSAYVPVALVFLKGKVRARSFYAIAMVGVVVIFPVLNLTTRFGIEGLAEHGDTLLTDALALQFVDSYDLLVECVRYVDVNGLNYGAKLLADLVVFFPRALWAGKPTLGGLDVGGRLLQSGLFGTANVSQMIAADAYMDFSLPGVVIIGGLIAVVVNRLILSERRLVNGHDLLAYCFVAALPILLRGPLAAVITIFLFQGLTLLALRRRLGSKIPITQAVQVAGLGVKVRKCPQPSGEGPNTRILSRGLPHIPDVETKATAK